MIEILPQCLTKRQSLTHKQQQKETIPFQMEECSSRTRLIAGRVTEEEKIGDRAKERYGHPTSKMPLFGY